MKEEKVVYALRYKDPNQPYFIGIWGEKKIAKQMKQKFGEETVIVILKEIGTL